MKDTSIATLRTGWFAAVVAIVIEVVRRVTGIELTPTEAFGLLATVGTVLYRIGRELEARWPWTGRVLFGSTKTPIYTQGEH